MLKSCNFCLTGHSTLKGGEKMKLILSICHTIYKPDKCKKCDGSGEYYGKKCPECNGTGKYYNPLLNY